MSLPINSVFICYRKDDSAGWSAKLADDLRAILGNDAVFIDDSIGIPFGTQWPNQISIALDQCRVFLPVIAPSWHQTTNLNRLKDPDDWVRRELTTAHARGGSVLCIPVFVNEANILTAEHFSGDRDLQQVIVDLMEDQGVKLDRSTEFWPAKVDNLISRISSHLGVSIPKSYNALATEDPDDTGSHRSSAVRWLHDNATWLSSVGAIAGIIALTPMFCTSQEPQGGNTIRVKGGDNSGQIAGGDITNTRDPEDKATIASQQRIIDYLFSQLSTSDQNNVYGSIREEITDAVTGLSETGSAEMVTLAEEALARGKPEVAKSLHKAYAESQTAANEPKRQEEAEAYRRWGALAFVDNTAEALEAYKKAVEVWPEDIRAWNQLGHLYLRMGESDSAFEAYKTVADLADSTEEPQVWTAVTLGNLAHVHRVRSELDDALEKYERMLEIASELGRKGTMALTYGHMGAVYEARGELDDAITMYKKSLAIETELDSKIGIAVNYTSLGNVYEDKGDFAQAVEMLENALTMNTKLGLEPAMAIDYFNLAIVYHRHGELDDAVVMYKKALALNIDQEYKKRMVDTYDHLGGEYLKRGQLGDAVLMLENALTLNTELENKAGMAAWQPTTTT